MERPTDVLETGEYIEPAKFESEQEAALFYSYLELLNYIEYLEAKVKTNPPPLRISLEE